VTGGDCSTSELKRLSASAPQEADCGGRFRANLLTNPEIGMSFSDYPILRTKNMMRHRKIVIVYGDLLILSTL